MTRRAAEPLRSLAVTGVGHVMVVLTGLAPTDLATAGTVAFDDVGLFVR
jgi:hypothetical protein